MKKIFFIFLFLLLLSSVEAKTIKMIGNVISNGQKMIGSKYMGYVSKVYVDIGDRVKREDDLYEIESSEFDLIKTQSDLMFDQSKLIVDYWKSRIDRLNKKRKRVQKRATKGFQFDLDDLEVQAENAKAMLEAAKIAVRQSVEKIKEISSVFNYLKMKSPADGIVVERNIRVGDMIMPGMLAILIVDTEDLFVDVSMAESLIRDVYVGKKVIIRIPSLEKEFKGKIKAIVPSSNFVTHKIKVRISIDDKHPRILPGMYSEVYLETKDKKKNVNKIKIK